MSGRYWSGALATLCSMGGGAMAETEGLFDSGIERPSYQQILNVEEDLAKAAQGWVTIEEYGKSVEGRPLRALMVQDPSRGGRGHGNPGGASPALARPAVIITGATHGNEYLNIEDRIAPWLVEHHASSTALSKFFNLGGTVIIVPIVNPDGFTKGTRENSRGFDLNRDFDLLPLHEAHFRSPESKQLADWLDHFLADSQTSLRLSVDYHCCDGSLLFPWSYTDARIPAFDHQRHESIGKLVQKDIDPAYSFGATGEVLGYLARGTSKDYYYARYHALAFTFEGTYRDEPSKFPRHTQWWEHVLDQVADGEMLSH